jgi:class 3 adenylate cyclase
VLRAFLVDDDAFFQQTIGDGLMPHGIVATPYADASSCLAALLSDAVPPDLVITDMVMPGVDGLRLVAMIRAHPRGRDVAVIVVSSQGSPAEVATAVRLGADDCVGKPLDMADLAARCHAAVMRRQEPAAQYARVNVAVLFTDLRGFTALSSHLDPESVVEMLNGLFELFVGDVQRAGGYVDKLIGDGMMALFGAPAAHSAPVLAAVEAAVAIRRSAASFERDSVLLAGRSDLKRLGVGSGIAYGQAVAGMLGPPGKRDFTAIGDPVNLASRLQALAHAGEIMLDRAAASAVANAVPFRPPRMEPIKGLGMVEVYEVNVDG